MSVKIRTKNGRLYLDVYWNGRRWWQALHLSVGEDKEITKQNYQLAERCRLKLEQQLVNNEWGFLDPLKAKASLYQYAEQVALSKLNKGTKSHLYKSLKYLREYGKEIRIAEVDAPFLEGYQSFLLERVGKSTAAHYYAALKTLLKKAVRDRILPRNPADHVKGISIPEKPKVYLTRDEIKRLVQTPLQGTLGQEVKKAFLFALYTGLRISDLRDLRWGDIQREPLQILKQMKKTEQVVAVPLNISAWKLINDKAIHPASEKVFPLLSHSRTNTNAYLKQWAKRAGIDKRIGWHTARHSFAVHTLEGGADFFTVSKLLGHKKPTTTMIYAQATDKMLKKAVENLPILEVEDMITRSGKS